MSNSITPAANYKLVMDSITLGTPIDKALFSMAVEYAKSSKRRTPKTEKFVETVKPAKKAAAVKKVPQVVKKCSEAGCQTVASAKGLCSKHYTAKRRQDPAERAKANEASRRWREKNVTITPVVATGH